MKLAAAPLTCRPDPAQGMGLAPTPGPAPLRRRPLRCTGVATPQASGPHAPAPGPLDALFRPNVAGRLPPAAGIYGHNREELHLAYRQAEQAAVEAHALADAGWRELEAMDLGLPLTSERLWKHQGRAATYRDLAVACTRTAQRRADSATSVAQAAWRLLTAAGCLAPEREQRRAQREIENPYGPRRGPKDPNALLS